jgi:hypothetical protein
MGTTYEGFRKGVAGGTGWITIPEHAGQVPTVHPHYLKK